MIPPASLERLAFGFGSLTFDAYGALGVAEGDARCFAFSEKVQIEVSARYHQPVVVAGRSVLAFAVCGDVASPSLEVLVSPNTYE
jgi:hypothetical protein